MAKGTKKAKASAPADLRGMIVQDKITGFKGTAISMLYYLSGTVQAGVDQGVTKEGKMGEVVGLDVDRIKITKMGPVKPTVPDNTDHIQLGFTAVDRITKARGVITEKAVYLNGCTSFVLSVESVKKDERGIVLDWKRLDLAGSTNVMTPPPAPEAGVPPKGGARITLSRDAV